MSEDLETTKELQDLMCESVAAEACRDSAINLVFRTSRALYYAKIALNAESKFWKLATKLHPEIKNETYHYNHDEKVIRKGDGKI